MKSRFKFTKQGHVKFVGHLDTVRLFQRAVRVAGIPIAYSQGFNPHALVYFAMPLSVGVSSISEYLEVVTTEDLDPQAMMQSLNAVLPEGIKILEAFQIEEKGPTLMSLVQEADYRIYLPKASVDATMLAACKARLEAPEILTMKKGKKKTTEVDLKPLIRAYTWDETATNDTLFVKVAAGSAENLSPDLLLKAITDKACEQWDYAIEREALYTTIDDTMQSISCYGRIDG